MSGQPNIAALRELAAVLTGETVLSLAPSGEGANSRIFRLATSRRTLALKCYPAWTGDTRDRLDVEWKALSFLRGQGLTVVPEPIAVDRARRVMLMEWLEGPVVARHTSSDLDAAIAFIERIFQSSAAVAGEEFPLASEACLSATTIVAQINSRLSMLPVDAEPAEFIEQELRPALTEAVAAVRSDLAVPGDLDPGLRRLIPADFGFHNAIRTPSGQLRFFDLDYFGWDDPVKLTADFLLHPAMTLSHAEAAVFRDRMAAALPADHEFLERLERHLRLYAIRWALILLNPFRHDRTAGAPADVGERRRLADDRIGKARRVLTEARRLIRA